MLKFGNLSSQFSKTNVRCEISTFEIEYRQNFRKIKKMILLDAKCPYLGICAQSFRKSMSDMKSSHRK